MIPLWRQIQRRNICSLEKLIDFLQLQAQKDLLLSQTPFPLNLPLRLAEKIKKGSLDDPILKQFVPLQEELKTQKDFSSDPVKDTSFQKSEKLLHKYQNRALLVTSSACAMHCRYCFRKNFPYETQRKEFTKELTLIQNDPSLNEIILSGGDPLSLSQESLSSLLLDLEKIPHLKRIRFHTRFPIGIPERIDQDFLSLLQEYKKQIFFVIHTNHPNELDEDIFFSLKQLQKLGIPTLNQSVLLKGVNDDVHTLATLFENLADHGITPYYLHQLDKVSGAMHFEVPEEEGKRIMQQLSKRLSGYSLPKYAKEEPGMPCKTLISY